MGVLSFFFSLAILLVSVYSKNKYCILSATRSALMTATLELVFGVVVLTIISYIDSFSFSMLSAIQKRNTIFLFATVPAAPFLLLIFLLETARIPFDLVEAESELVAGYSNELGGFFFALFYLGEYFHLFFASLFFGILFFGA
jgi:NADH-quinone oxidoreductase subunit H